MNRFFGSPDKNPFTTRTAEWRRTFAPSAPSRSGTVSLNERTSLLARNPVLSSLFNGYASTPPPPAPPSPSSAPARPASGGWPNLPAAPLNAVFGRLGLDGTGSSGSGGSGAGQPSPASGAGTEEAGTWRGQDSEFLEYLRDVNDGTPLQSYVWALLNRISGNAFERLGLTKPREDE